MLKLEIWPAFLNRSTLELKNLDVGWELFVTKDAFEELNDPGQIWHAQEMTPQIPEKIVALVQDLLQNPSAPRYGLDGVSVALTFKKELQEQKFTFWSPAPETPESKLMGLLFDLAVANVSDPNCATYFSELKAYFAD